MNALAEAARRAVSDPDYTQEPGWCQAFARQVVESVCGDRYDWAMADSALHTMQRFVQAGMTVEGPPEPGDLLYKGTRSGPFGHVGIYVGEGQVAENSSTRTGRVQGAKGYRSLARFGTVDAIVRLAVEPAWTVALPDGQSLATRERHDTVWVAARAWAAALGLVCDEAQQRVRIGGRVIRREVWRPDGQPWLPIRDVAWAAGLEVAVSGRQVRVLRPRARTA